MHFLTQLLPIGHSANAGGGGGFDPSTLSLTAWWEDYTGSPPLVGKASLGSSGSHNLATQFLDPGNGAALNGHSTIGYAGGQALRNAADGTAAFVSTTAYTISVLAKPISAFADTGNVFDAPAFIGDSFRRIGASFSSAGFLAWHFDGTSWISVPAIACATGSYHSFQMRYDGTNITARLDSGAWQSQPAGNMDPTTQFFESGVNWAIANFLNADVASIIASNVHLSDANCDGIKSYYNSKYALHL